MMRVVMAAMAVAMATPVAAQDAVADAREAYTGIWGDGEATAVAAAEVGLSILPTIAGAWIDVAPGPRGPEEIDADFIAGVCGIRPITISNVGDYGFQLEMTRRGEPTGDVRTYMFATGSYYSFITDLNGFLGTLTGDRELTEFPEQLVLAWLQSGTSGIARVEAVGPDVLVVDSPTAGAMILVRCP